MAELLRALGHRRRAVGVALAVAMVVLTVPVAYNRIDANRRISESQVPWQDEHRGDPGAARSCSSGGPAATCMFLNPYSANRASLHGSRALRGRPG